MFRVAMKVFENKKLLCGVQNYTMNCRSKLSFEYLEPTWGYGKFRICVVFGYCFSF